MAASRDLETWGRDWVNSGEPRGKTIAKTRILRRGIQQWSNNPWTLNPTTIWWSWLQIKSSREVRSSILVRLWSSAPNQSLRWSTAAHLGCKLMSTKTKAKDSATWLSKMTIKEILSLSARCSRTTQDLSSQETAKVLQQNPGNHWRKEHWVWLTSKRKKTLELRNGLQSYFSQ